MSLSTLIVAIGPLFLLTAAQSQPVVVASSQFLGNVTSVNSQVIRDLGFHGQIGNLNMNSYGDTFWCSTLNKDTRDGCTLPLAANSLSFSTGDPCDVEDFNLHGVQHVPYQFCPYNSDWGETAGSYGLGISGVVETAADTGVVFFARNYRPAGKPGGITGAGVAIVDTSGPFPTCTRTAMQWWDCSQEPTYGDHGAVDGNDGYVYAFGQFGSDMQLFLARALKTQATNLDSYQYWDGTQFSSARLYNPGAQQAVLLDTNQGYIGWSNYFKCWISVTRSRWDMVSITMRTAPALQGPWSNETHIWEAPKIVPENMVYGPTVHPHYDESGKSFVISYTQTSNIQQAAKITFQ